MEVMCQCVMIVVLMTDEGEEGASTILDIIDTYGIGFWLGFLILILIDPEYGNGNGNGNGKRYMVWYIQRATD